MVPVSAGPGAAAPCPPPYELESCKARYSSGLYFVISKGGSADGDHLVIGAVTKARQQCAHRVLQGGVAEVGIVQRGDAGVGMAQQLRDREQVRAGLGEQGRVGVTQIMKADRRHDARCRTGLAQDARVVVLVPGTAICCFEHSLVSMLVDYGRREEVEAVRRQRNVAGLAALRLWRDVDHGSVEVDVVDHKARELAVARAGEQRGLHQPPQVGAADIEEADAVGLGQKPRRRLIHVVKRLDLAPREGVRDQIVLEGLVSSALKIVSTRLAEALRARCASGVSGGARNAGASASARVRLRAGPSASCWCQSRNS